MGNNPETNRHLPVAFRPEEVLDRAFRPATNSLSFHLGQGILDEFGRVQVGEPLALWDSEFQYNLHPLFYHQTVVNGGTITHDADHSSARLNVTTTDGSSAILQSYEYFRYQPGKAQQLSLAFLFAVVTTGLDQRVGQFDDDNGFFFEADTIEELAEAIRQGNEYQKVPLTYLQETVDRWNSFVDAGFDDDFERGPDAPLHAIGTPPLYGASIPIEWHDSCGGLRINGKGQVLDMQGEVIAGLFAGGESVGGSEMHGLGRATTQGYIAASTAAA